MVSWEALCATIVDRIQPLTLNICSKGKIWHEHRVTVEKVLKRNKIVLDSAPEIISEYVRNKITEAAEKQYFYNENEDRALKDNSCQSNDISIRNAGAGDIKLLAAMN